MSKERKPPGGRSGNDDDFDPWSYPEVFAMTVRHGAEHAKRHYDALALAERGDKEMSERWRALRDDPPRAPAQAEVIAFPRKETKP